MNISEFGYVAKECKDRDVLGGGHGYGKHGGMQLKCCHSGGEHEVAYLVCKVMKCEAEASTDKSEGESLLYRGSSNGQGKQWKQKERKQKRTNGDECRAA